VSLALPIDAILPDLIARLRDSTSVVLRAPTGAGKTTRVPPAILDAGLAGAGQVVLLQPRRLAARAAAARMAAERGVSLGDEVGYQVRFERKSSRATRILAMTDGLFVRMLQEDACLERVGAVVFDEFHERSIHTDLALAMVRRVQEEVRPELKVVVMSATLAAMPVSRYLHDCPTLESEGRLHPVTVNYLRHESQSPLPVAVAAGVRQVLEQTSGDVLAFLPGVGEIRRTADELTHFAREQDWLLMELYGDMPLEQQQAVLRPAERRKIVLATNVAETSVTIEGITGVVDSGLARVLRLDPAIGLDRLDLTRISKASADQRTGRAGRLAPGFCLRLWTEQQQRGLSEQLSPEIQRVDLAGPALELLAWGEKDLAAFPWFDAPPAFALEHALELLKLLGAIDGNQVTTLGRGMVRLPAHPRVARILLEGRRLGQAKAAALAGALLAERNPFRVSCGASAHRSDSDVLDRMHALEEFERSGRTETLLGRLDRNAGRFILRARDQLLRLLETAVVDERETRVSADEAVLRALLAGFPDRLAKRREGGARRAVLVGGRGVRIADESAVTEAKLFVCVDLEEIGKSDSLARQVSAVEPDWLPEGMLSTAVDVEFDPARERVVAYRRTRWQDLVIDESITNVPVDFDAASVLAQAAADRIDSLRLDDEAAQLIARIRFLREWMPELDLPLLSEQPLRELLPQLCVGCLSLGDLRKAPVVYAIKSLLTPSQLAALEREAPARLRVPTGSQITLRYEFGQPPVLAVRIQELFGMQQTPQIAGGRVGVLLHLLAPNMRPQQVTSDLASFWANTYSVVRKDLRRRYPKHSWPEDPYTATPVRKGR